MKTPHTLWTTKNDGLTKVLNVRTEHGGLRPLVIVEADYPIFQVWCRGTSITKCDSVEQAKRVAEAIVALAEADVTADMLPKLSLISDSMAFAKGN